MTAPADDLEDNELEDDEEILFWARTDCDGQERFYTFRPDDIASIHFRDRWLLSADFSSLVAFEMASVPDRRLWS